MNSVVHSIYIGTIMQSLLATSSFQGINENPINFRLKRGSFAVGIMQEKIAARDICRVTPYCLIGPIYILPNFALLPVVMVYFLKGGYGVNEPNFALFSSTRN